MLVEYTRVVAECDDCGREFGPGEDMVSWFDTFDQARDELSADGWSGIDAEDRRLLCPWCTCVEQGHCLEVDATPSVTWPDKGFRGCGRCAHVEIVPIASAPHGSMTAAGASDESGSGVAS